MPSTTSPRRLPRCAMTDLAMLALTIPGWRADMVGEDIRANAVRRRRPAVVRATREFWLVCVAPGTGWSANPNTMWTIGAGRCGFDLRHLGPLSAPTATRSQRQASGSAFSPRTGVVPATRRCGRGRSAHRSPHLTTAAPLLPRSATTRQRQHPPRDQHLWSLRRHDTTAS